MRLTVKEMGEETAEEKKKDNLLFEELTYLPQAGKINDKPLALSPYSGSFAVEAARPRCCHLVIARPR